MVANDCKGFRGGRGPVVPFRHEIVRGLGEAGVLWCHSAMTAQAGTAVLVYRVRVSRVISF